MTGLPSVRGAAESPLALLQAACESWISCVGSDPDFLLVPGTALRELRLELRMALRMEMPSIDEMRRVAARGELVVGGFRVFVGTDYGAGVMVRQVPDQAAGYEGALSAGDEGAANDDAALNPVRQDTGD